VVSDCCMRTMSQALATFRLAVAQNAGGSCSCLKVLLQVVYSLLPCCCSCTCSLLDSPCNSGCTQGAAPTLALPPTDHSRNCCCCCVCCLCCRSISCSCQLLPAVVCCSPQLDAQDSRIMADSASGWRLTKPKVELSWPDVIRPVGQQQQQPHRVNSKTGRTSSQPE
jgi:hypothetical protein